MVQSTGYISNVAKILSSYGKSIDNTRLRIKSVSLELQTVRDQINEGIISGLMTTDDDNYIKLNQRLEELQNELVTTTSDLYTLYEEMYNIPNEVATEKLDKIAKSYRNLSAAISGATLETTGN